MEGVESRKKSGALVRYSSTRGNTATRIRQPFVFFGCVPRWRPTASSGPMLILALPATSPCKLCLPCITPPCYKQEPGVSYTTNAPGDSYGGDSSSCWRQRLLTPHKVPGAGGVTGELCGCPADWSEYES